MVLIIRKLLDLFSPREKIHLYLLVAAMAAMAVVETVGIASIMPFMAVVANPKVIHSNKWLSWSYELLGFGAERDFLFFLGILVLCLLVFGNLFKAWMTWWVLKFDNILNHNLARRLLARYLLRPYIFFLNRNTSELGKNVLNEARNVIVGVLSPGMQILSSGLVAGCIFVLLLMVNPLVSLTIALGLGGVYVGIYLVVRRRLTLVGQEQLKANTMKFKLASEALGGVKDVKILGCEQVFIDRFSLHTYRHAISNVIAGTLGQLPRYMMEVLAFGGMLLIMLYHLRTGADSQSIVPLMALYAFAGYRLLPALQQIFASVAMVRCGVAALDLLHQDLVEKQGMGGVEPFAGQPANLMPLPFTRELELRNVEFYYPTAREPALRAVDLTISPNTTIGFVGATGSGKTTAVDLILGLLTPASGQILVDEVLITGTDLLRWQLNLGYVPQSIYLSDDTVARNIAFGVRDSEIDMTSVIRAAEIANLADFIEKKLPEGYQTIIGDRGVRLSGGQRQRIGIARALYRDPAVLILDEATSALDGLTEDAVMDAIRDLSKKKTIIMIAHRLTTVRDCDVIYLLEHGRIVAQGDFASLQQSSQWFRRVAQTTK